MYSLRKIEKSRIVGACSSPTFFLALLGTLLLLTTVGADICAQETSVPDSGVSSSALGDTVTDSSEETSVSRVHTGWIHPERVNVFVIIAIFFLLVLILTHLAQRGKELVLRDIPGFRALEEAIGRAAETERPVLYVPGVFDVDNIQTIASMAILVDVAKKAANKLVRLIVPLNRAFLVPLAEESVKRGMDEAGKPEMFDPTNIRYLSDDHFAYAAAVDGIMLREKPGAIFYLGGFGAESLILAETGYSVGALQVAGTAETQQLPFLVVACDHTLIGEEFYAASAYISREPKLLGSLRAADVIKAMVIAILVLGSILELFGIHTIRSWFVVQ